MGKKKGKKDEPTQTADGEQSAVPKKLTKEEKRAAKKAKKEAKALKKKLAALEVRYVRFRLHLNCEVKNAEFTHHCAGESFEELCTILNLPELLEDENFKNISTKLDLRKKGIRLILREWAAREDAEPTHIKDHGDIVKFMSNK